ncbi:FKBP-type peptidyl-prolyl cis-trans isomerase [Croceicoccus mobilis]|uniref:Peptidyl-prolyl cis-trans isomerase n=1 Tax=Croceicoccus mobilis TaxID=1703339 RepID=A0A916YR54_9SPHN|nr:FKBP-type peptidyl-prolyl cis-trans isomerase [Croceicoccus mobilis]GGD56585.1 hypothetical protein GCM10010990_02260 [Croceicoccus mobilis]
MAEITRVPLQPIGKGILSKLWIGVVIAVLLAAGAAYASRYHGLEVTTLSEGTGGSPTLDDVVNVNYTGKLPDGTVFDQGEGAVFPVKGVVPGFRDALLQMKKGGRYEVYIPSDQAYGAEGAGNGAIPPNADLTFEVELLDFRSEAELRAIQQQMQAMGLGGMGGPGGPGGAPQGAQ